MWTDIIKQSETQIFEIDCSTTQLITNFVVIGYVVGWGGRRGRQWKRQIYMRACINEKFHPKSNHNVNSCLSDGQCVEFSDKNKDQRILDSRWAMTKGLTLSSSSRSFTFSFPRPPLAPRKHVCQLCGFVKIKPTIKLGICPVI